MFSIFKHKPVEEALAIDEPLDIDETLARFKVQLNNINSVFMVLIKETMNIKDETKKFDQFCKLNIMIHHTKEHTESIFNEMYKAIGTFPKTYGDKFLEIIKENNKNGIRMV